MRTLLAATALAGALLQPSPASAQVLSDGHVDYAVRMIDGQLRSQIKDGTRATTVWREVPAVTFAVTDGARTTVPASAPFLGSPGDAVWLLPQTQRAGLLWPGWNTEELTAAQVDGAVTWRLDAVEGPGAVTVFQTGVFGDPQFVFRSADGLPDSYSIPLGTHAHANWAFTREGAYRLTFTMSARLRDGRMATDTQTLPVTVGTGPDPTPTPTPCAGAATAAGRAAARASAAPTTSRTAAARATARAAAPPPCPSATPAPTPTPGAGGSAPDSPPAATAPALRPLSARVAGRTLRLRVRLDRRARLAVTLQRSGRTSARATPRTVAAGTRTLKLRLNRRPVSGRHTVRITATTDGRSRTRTLALRVRN